ncbi:MAG: metallophosphoesterase family protein [Deltaproteobacteria bacterium]|jgi:hypothetical protein
MTEPGRIAYVTDLEGRWDKLATFAEGQADVWLARDGSLALAEGVTFVFGGDVCDRGAGSRRLVEVLLEAKRRYGDRVVLLAGNRDLNKLRLRRELDGFPPARTPSELRSGARAPLLRWILEHTMGARDAFEHRRAELASPRAVGATSPTDVERTSRVTDEAVAESFLDDIAPGGPMRAYLRACRLAYRAGPTLFVHGGITEESLFVAPHRAGRVAGVDAWLSELDGFLSEQLDRFERGEAPDALMAYQAPRSGTIWNQASVVYGRPADEDANPELPSDAVIRALGEAGVSRLVVGHTPSGDCPAVVRDAGFELVLADNSYGRLEQGSRVVVTTHETHVVGETLLDDGTRALVSFSARLGRDEGPLGRRDDASGALVKARLERGGYLLFRGLPGRRVSQTLASEEDVERMRLRAAR